MTDEHLEANRRNWNERVAIRTMIVRTLRLALVTCVMVSAGCSDSDDDGATPPVDDPAAGVAPPLADEPASPEDAPVGDGPGEAPAGSGAIRVDNHVELLAHVFDIYTGNAWGPALVALPDYSALPDLPSPADLTADSFPISAICENGGTVDFVPDFTGPFGSFLGWDYTFDDCQDGGDVLQGRLSVKGYGNGLRVSSPEFTLIGPAGRTRFRGNVEWVYGGLRSNPDQRSWTATAYAPDFTSDVHDSSGDGVDFVLTDADGNATFELLGARTDVHYTWPTDEGSLEGGFAIRSEASGGERLTVTILERFDHDGGEMLPSSVYPEDPKFETGVLRVSAANGDTIVVDAATGDIDTVRIEITVGGRTETVMQPWSLWREHLAFDEALRDQL